MKTQEQAGAAGVQVVEFTSRRCRSCGRFYAWPKGSRRPGARCPSCQPELPFEAER